MNSKTPVSEIIEKAQKELGFVNLEDGTSLFDVLERINKEHPTKTILWGDLYQAYKATSAKGIIEDQDKHSEHLHSLTESNKEIYELLFAIGRTGVKLLIASVV